MKDNTDGKFEVSRRTNNDAGLDLWQAVSRLLTGSTLSGRLFEAERAGELESMGDVRRAALEFFERFIDECGYEMPWSPRLRRALSLANRELRRAAPAQSARDSEDETLESKRAHAVEFVEWAQYSIADGEPADNAAFVLRCELAAYCDPDFIKLEPADLATDLTASKLGGPALLAKWIVVHVPGLGLPSEAHEDELDKIEHARKKLDDAHRSQRKLLKPTI